MKYFLLLSGLIWVQLTSVFSNIVVTSKPLYFVVAPILKGIETPKLVINHGHCGHHYHVRPSEIQLIKTAKLVLWNGSIHEPFMTKLVDTINSHQIVFDETDGLSWLSPNMTLMKLPKVVKALKSVYPEALHIQIDNNAKEFSIQLQKLHEKMLQHTACLKGKNILTTYPFLTYFANDYGLYVAAHMMGAPEESMTPQRLRNVHKVLENGGVLGVVKDHHVPINVVESLIRNYKIKVLTVDAEAVDIPLSINGYNILIERLTQSIVKWAQ
jgi:zinc transport system substrate-binding protein